MILRYSIRSIESRSIYPYLFIYLSISILKLGQNRPSFGQNRPSFGQNRPSFGQSFISL